MLMFLHSFIQPCPLIRNPTVYRFPRAARLFHGLSWIDEMVFEPSSPWDIHVSLTFKKKNNNNTVLNSQLENFKSIPELNGKDWQSWWEVGCITGTQNWTLVMIFAHRLNRLGWYLAQIWCFCFMGVKGHLCLTWSVTPVLLTALLPQGRSVQARIQTR